MKQINIDHKCDRTKFQFNCNCVIVSQYYCDGDWIENTMTFEQFESVIKFFNEVKSEQNFVNDIDEENAFAAEQYPSK